METILRFILPVVFLVALGCSPTTTWNPPANADPDVVLEEARRDSKAGRYETALAKFVWYHENALSIEPSVEGVRLSFALSYWHELAQKYPPALVAMQEARDSAAADVLSGVAVRRSFKDLAALDRELGQRVRTKELFETLDRDRPQFAQEVSDLAEPALVSQKAFELANKYVDPTADIAQIIERYREELRAAPDLDDPDLHRAFAKRLFTHQVATLVGILAANDRDQEAAAVAASAREEFEDPALDQSLAAALEGVVPEPWP